MTRNWTLEQHVAAARDSEHPEYESSRALLLTGWDEVPCRDPSKWLRWENDGQKWRILMINAIDYEGEGLTEAAEIERAWDVTTPVTNALRKAMQ